MQKAQHHLPKSYLRQEWGGEGQSGRRARTAVRARARRAEKKQERRLRSWEV